MTKEEYLRKVADMQTDISAIKQEGREESKTCNACIHKAVCYRYSYGLPENYADKCGDFQTQKSGKWEDLHRCWACSECGQETHIEHKYCPNCGAKMESEDRTE